MLDHHKDTHEVAHNEEDFSNGNNMGSYGSKEEEQRAGEDFAKLCVKCLNVRDAREAGLRLSIIANMEAADVKNELLPHVRQLAEQIHLHDWDELVTTHLLYAKSSSDKEIEKFLNLLPKDRDGLVDLREIFGMNAEVTIAETDKVRRSVHARGETNYHN